MQRLIAFVDDDAGLVRAAGTYLDTGSVTTAISAAHRIGKALQNESMDQRRGLVRQFTERITVEPGRLTISIDRAALAGLLVGTTVEHDESQERHLLLTCPISLRRRGVETRIVIPGSRKHRQADPIRRSLRFCRARMATCIF